MCKADGATDAAVQVGHTSTVQREVGKIEKQLHAKRQAKATADWGASGTADLEFLADDCATKDACSLFRLGASVLGAMDVGIQNMLEPNMHEPNMLEKEETAYGLASYIGTDGKRVGMPRGQAQWEWMRLLLDKHADEVRALKQAHHLTVTTVLDLRDREHSAELTAQQKVHEKEMKSAKVLIRQLQAQVTPTDSHDRLSKTATKVAPPINCLKELDVVPTSPPPLRTSRFLHVFSCAP